MVDIKLPFGLREDNTLAHVSDVQSGKQCGCVCPSCRTLLIAVKGNKRQHHFRHHIDYECAIGLESAIHLAAKQMIMEKKQITLPEYVSSFSAIDSRGVKHIEQETVVRAGRLIRFNAIEAERDIHEMKADILAIAGNIPLIIEVFYRHKVDDQKRLKIVKANTSAIEIDLSDLTPQDVHNWDAFWLSINDPKRITWLYNAKASNIYKKLKDKVEKKIQAQEIIYQQEEAKRILQEQKEKELLVCGLQELEKLRGNIGYSTRLRQEAERHPVWIRTSKYLPFSLHDLPDFLDLDVPDGDWIFGCDRRVWQTAFYSYFICKIGGPFSVRAVDKWLQNTVGCKVPLCAKNVGIYGRKYPQLVPLDIWDNMPSSWRTLRTYCEHLQYLDVLEYSGDDWKVPGNCWYRRSTAKQI